MEGEELTRSGPGRGTASGSLTWQTKGAGHSPDGDRLPQCMVTLEPAWGQPALPLGAWRNHRALYRGGRHEIADGSFYSFWRKKSCKKRGRTEESKTILTRGQARAILSLRVFPRPIQAAGGTAGHVAEAWALPRNCSFCPVPAPLLFRLALTSGPCWLGFLCSPRVFTPSLLLPFGVA